MYRQAVSEINLAAPADKRRLARLTQAAAIQGVAHEAHGIFTMPISDWLAIPDNPRQRNTEARARLARHLDVFEPIHAHVDMAILPDGTKFKLDGHTRSYKWTLSPEIAPREVTVRVWRCPDISAACDLYDRFDSKKAVETTKDQTFGACREVGLSLSSTALRGAGFGTAVRQLYAFHHGRALNAASGASVDVREAVRFYREELLLLDSIQPTTVRFVGGVTMAALATIKSRGRSAVRFWTHYQNDTGNKEAGQMDGVQALSDAVLRSRGRGRDKSIERSFLFLAGVSHYLKWERRKPVVNSARHLQEKEVRAFCQGSLDLTRAR